MNFRQFLADNAYALFLIMLIEACFIIMLVIYIIYYKFEAKEAEKKSTKDSPYFAGRNTSQFYSRNNSYENTNNKVTNRQIRDYERKTNTANSHVDQIKPPKSNLDNQTTPKYNGFDDYVAKEKAKGLYLKETTNEDGSVKSEISFDLTEDKLESVKISPKFEYLEAANGGQFRKLLPTDEKSFFRTWEENGIRKFEFHGSVEKALANINAIFDDVCEIEGKQSGATQIINVEPGVLSNQLIVETKAKIKLT